MTRSLLLAAACVVAIAASIRVLGWKLVLHILLSPIRRYDFDEEQP